MENNTINKMEFYQNNPDIEFGYYEGEYYDSKYKEFREKLSKEDIEDIFRIRLCWSYECGVLIAAMSYMGYTKKDIIDMISVIEAMIFMYNAKEIKTLYDNFLKEV